MLAASMDINGAAMTEPRKRKCRWCAYVIPATPRGYADLWKHVRKRHPKELTDAAWPELEPING